MIGLPKYLSLLISAVILMMLSGVVDSRASDDDMKNYPDIEKAFREWGDNVYWKAYTVTTKDGYVIRLFRILGRTETRRMTNHGEKGPLLLLHGFSSSAITWFHRNDESMAVIPTQLFKEGYDVWIGSIRGTPYARDHVDLDVDDDDWWYWDFDTSDIAEKDVYAMIEFIHKKSNSCQKITIVGHSAGTMQTFNLLSKARKADHYISQFIAMEPCIVPDITVYFPGLNDVFYLTLQVALNALDIQSIWSRNWLDQVEVVCWFLGDDHEICQELVSLEIATEDHWWGFRETSTKQTKHLAQTYLMDEFQEYTAWWFWPYRDTQNIQLKKISQDIPIRAVWSNQDKLCPKKKQMRWLRKVKSFDAEIEIEGEHGTASGKNDAQFLEQLKTLLQNSGEMMEDEHCEGRFNMGMKNTAAMTRQAPPRGVSIAAPGEQGDYYKFSSNGSSTNIRGGN